MTRAVFPLVPDPLGARLQQSPTADEIARIRAALPTGTSIMKGKWESMETAPRDGRPVWCAGFVDARDNRVGPFWGFFAEGDWYNANTYKVAGPRTWFNPEAAP